jgi:small subunit ribosomal protein S21
VKVVVRDNDVTKALKILKNKMQREGIFKDMRRVEIFEKPSEKRVREHREAIKRERKRQAKQLERDGY